MDSRRRGEREGKGKGKSCRYFISCLLLVVVPKRRGRFRRKFMDCDVALHSVQAVGNEEVVYWNRL